MIDIQGVSVSYDKLLVLSNISATLEDGGLYGILGPNGAGKSTLFKSILDLIPMDSGQILIDGKPFDEVRKRVAYIPQKGDVDWQFPASVKDVVMMGRFPHKKVWQGLNKTDRNKAQSAMEELGIADLQNRQIGELSGGQQQRVFIARALCQEADFYLLDEPFVGVDVVTEQKIIAILKKLAAQKKTLLVVHHDLSKVKEYFNQVILLNKELIAYGDTSTTFTEPNIAKTYGGEINLLHKAVLTK